MHLKILWPHKTMQFPFLREDFLIWFSEHLKIILVVKCNTESESLKHRCKVEFLVAKSTPV